MTGIELFIILGVSYAAATVGNAIISHLDYREAMLKYRKDYDS